MNVNLRANGACHLKWTANQKNIGVCDSSWGVDDNTEEETSWLKDSIKEVTEQSPFRGYSNFVFAIMMQETKGCVRVRTTVAPDRSVRNPGLMQTHNGKASCWNNGKGTKPCTKKQISAMINDGVNGEGGLKKHLQQLGGKTDATTLYQVARSYNSGSLAPSKNLGDGQGATPCYASDIANRLTGQWTDGPSTCNSNDVAKMATSAGGASGHLDDQNVPASGDGATGVTSASFQANSATTQTWHAVAQPILPSEPNMALRASTSPSPTPNIGVSQQSGAATSRRVLVTTAPPAPSISIVEKRPVPSPALNAPVSTPVTPANAGNMPAPIQASRTLGSPNYPSSLSSCQQRHLVVDNDYCLKLQQAFNVSLNELRRLNPGLNQNCSNLWLGYHYCVKGN
ncbi:hypothetical protein NUU61_001583 [Penicillium alfredii]|uniref:LysM domain-containing protein n=1 Tax=Penicillium alfredii TaxID=1506179 RepID=A0A9W9G4K1_9EURO|nr:uncharacterized protein NUU61_001583 [Penicillium alfredii]KAJ5111953.1 hypothetical protein NUU61_001583 [Penicillium alfredii]